MPIQMGRHPTAPGESCPMIFCDHCGEQIIQKQGLGGIVSYPMTDGQSDIRFLHKGRCDQAVNPRGSDRGAWDEMPKFLDDLRHNTLDFEG